MMAPCGLKFAVTLILIFSLSFLPSKSVESCKICGRHNSEWLTRKTMYITCDIRYAGLQWSSLKQRKMLIGSRPPGCVNKCMSCRPCMATLVVIHPHDNNKKGEFAKISDSVSRREDDDPYYLLSWKCKCGDKLYQP